MSRVSAVDFVPAKEKIRSFTSERFWEASSSQSHAGYNIRRRLVVTGYSTSFSKQWQEAIRYDMI
jgi:hypothetical protein